MADRSLRVPDVLRLFEAHGCVAVLDRGFVRISRGEGSEYRGWLQHAHKGRKDKFDRLIIRVARRRLGFADMSDEEFYAPLG